mmetsp:Transcript_7582/g.16395  ORF Transcript_7582/g.16395 Transcript_7582/m.16395 type:complete len:871 (-) Transcript_7582:200-2812(-)
MSSKSPGQGNSRGSPDRPSAGTNPDLSIGESNLLPEEDRIDQIIHQHRYRPTSIQTQLNLLQQHIAPRDQGDASIVRGGTHSPHQSRLIGYTASFSTGHHSLPQSYPAGQPSAQSFAQSYSPPFSQNYSPPLPPIHLTNEASPSGNIAASSSGNIGEVTHELLGSLSQWSVTQSRIPSLPSSAVSPPQHTPRARGRRFSASMIPPAQASLPQATSHPQIPRTLLPSITNLSVDTDTQRSISGQLPSPISPSTSSVQSPFLASPDDLKPLPQNLRGDPFRSAKVKTELCRFYKTPKGCIFGDKCNYAHGENELKFNKLMDLETAGLVDVEVFMCHVCLTWVATGACPFDQRCTRLHDPRVIGIEPSWLPHAEVLVNNTKKGREVDKLYHQQYCSIYSCSPIYGFAPKKRWKADETSTNAAWKELYSFCCNTDANQPYSQCKRWQLSPQKNAQGAEITEMHWLAMALMMREGRKAQCFTYLPSHVFWGELCLLLQTSYFELKVVESYQDIQRYEVVQVSEEEATKISDSGKGSRIIVARQIAFGPVADASVRQVSIWFDIKQEDIVPCTRQQARRHRRSRHRIRAKRNNENQPGEAKIAASYSIPPFTCHEPTDEAAFNLITGIQTYRYRVLRYLSSSPDERALRSLALEEEKLRNSFESQRRFWMTWTWPKKIGSCDIGNETEVPDVDGIYNFVIHGDPKYREDSLFFGSDVQDGNADDSLEIVSKQAKLATGLVWKSFVMNLQLFSYQGAIALPKEEDEMPIHDPIIPTIRRIPTLRSLSLGFSAFRHSTRNIPRINSPVCTTAAPVVTSLDVLIHEWKMMQRQYEENSSYPLKDAKQGNGRHPDPAKRRPLSYSFEKAARSWTRELPKL